MHSSTAMCFDIGLERVHYFARQLITADDMTAEQFYFRQKLRRHNRFLHGWGVVCGCDVMPMPDATHPWQVRVCPGYAVGPQGDEIMIADPVDFDLAGDWRQTPDPCARPWPCPPTGHMPTPGREQPVYLAVRYAECDARPVRVHPVGCACDEAACEYSRTRDSFELALLWELPEVYRRATAADQLWCDEFQQWVANQRGGRDDGVPVPDCSECPDMPWVILARIMLPESQQTPIDTNRISYGERRVLWSVGAVQTLFLCLINSQS